MSCLCLNREFRLAAGPRGLVVRLGGPVGALRGLRGEVERLRAERDFARALLRRRDVAIAVLARRAGGSLRFSRAELESVHPQTLFTEEGDPDGEGLVLTVREPEEAG